MPQLIKKIQGFFPPYLNGGTRYVNTISGVIQGEDYINIPNFVGLIQNLTQTELTVGMDLPITFGLKNQDNTSMITLNIDY